MSINRTMRPNAQRRNVPLIGHLTRAGSALSPFVARRTEVNVITPAAAPGDVGTSSTGDDDESMGGGSEGGTGGGAD